jgi:hypothetical protein
MSLCTRGVGADVRVTTVVRTWFGRGTSSLARKCDLVGFESG